MAKKELTEELILKDAEKKHGIKFSRDSMFDIYPHLLLKEYKKMLLELIRYSRQIGYNEGYIDGHCETAKGYSKHLKKN